MEKIDRLLEKIYYRQNGDRYINYLRRKGIKIGEGTKIFDPHNIHIDITRPELVEIGKMFFCIEGQRYSLTIGIVVFYLFP